MFTVFFSPSFTSDEEGKQYLHVRAFYFSLLPHPLSFEVTGGFSQVLVRTMNTSRLYVGFPAISNTHVAPVQRATEVSAMLPCLHGLKVGFISGYQIAIKQYVNVMYQKTRTPSTKNTKPVNGHGPYPKSRACLPKVCFNIILPSYRYFKLSYKTKISKWSFVFLSKLHWFYLPKSNSSPLILEAVMVMIMKVTVFWDVTPCSL